MGADQIRAFLEAHILVDIQHMSRCAGESGDDCILLLHELINRMKRGKLLIVIIIIWVMACVTE